MKLHLLNALAALLPIGYFKEVSVILLSAAIVIQSPKTDVGLGRYLLSSFFSQLISFN